jgi:hypothetical protein
VHDAQYPAQRGTNFVTDIGGKLVPGKVDSTNRLLGSSRNFLLSQQKIKRYRKQRRDNQADGHSLGSG